MVTRRERRLIEAEHAETAEQREKRLAIQRKANDKRAIAASLQKRATQRAARNGGPLIRRASPSPRRQSAIEMLDAFLDQSVENVGTAIMNGDVDVSKWLMERIAKAEGTVIPSGVFDDVDRDPTEAAQQIVTAVLRGGVSVESGLKLLELIERRAGLDAHGQLDELRALIEEINGAKAKTINGETVSPAWLKLKEGRPQ